MKKTFKTIASAISSSNLEAQIAESVRIFELMGDRLILVNVGDNDQDSKTKIMELAMKFSGNSPHIEVVTENGDPVNAILKIARNMHVDLIITGAEPREGLLKYYKGSIARRLVRQSNCSTLLLSRSTAAKAMSRRVVVNGLDHPKTASTLRTALSVAENLKSSNMVIVEEVEPTMSNTRREFDCSKQLLSEEQRIKMIREDQRIDRAITAALQNSSVTVSQKSIAGKKGYTIGHYTESTRADLLVINSPDTKVGYLDRVFTKDLDYLLEELPSDLLIVHSNESS